MAQFVCDTARAWIAANLHGEPQAFAIESAVRPGSPNLRRVFEGAARRRANDTSFGSGFAPYSPLEQATLQLARVLCSPVFRARFPVAGDDYKIMALRVDSALRFTLALAIVDREVRDPAGYFAAKAEILRYLHDALGLSCEM